MSTGRNLDALPKAHLHLHFTGSMSLDTLRRLAAEAHLDIPDSLLDSTALDVPYTVRGWYRFQRFYDVARRVVNSEAALRHVVRQAAFDDAAEGSRRLEIQVDPTSYAPYVGGLIEALEIVMDEARAATEISGVQVGVIVAASRIRHPLDARTLARLASKHAGTGPGQICGFGLSNDERAGNTRDWEMAFQIARRAGLPGVPHGGELLGPEHIRTVIEALQPTRLGHGVRVAEDPALLREVVERKLVLEVCPMSNVRLGVYHKVADVPLRTLVAAGARIALSADDPLLFLSRLSDQYRVAREEHGFSDEELAALAASSIDASFATDSDKARWHGEIASWLATEPERTASSRHSAESQSGLP